MVASPQLQASELDPLAPRHALELREGSGISDEVIRERGYRTVWGKNDAVLLEKSFKQSQRRGFGWVAPLFSPLGIKECIYKPDDPRSSGGKPIKYEYPQGHKPILDAHPRTLSLLPIPEVRLFITEGVKKGDALVSRGEAAISLQGVYGWRGRNAYRGATALGDWEGIALNDRTVYIAFDSDSSSNPNVQAAQRRVARFLSAKGALVRIIHLPAGPGGKKHGVDDFFVSGGTIEGLLSLAEPFDEVGRHGEGALTAPETSFAAPRVFARTDSGNAELLAHLYGEDLRYDHKRSRWLIWRDGRWEVDRTEYVYQLAKQAARRRYLEALDVADLNERVAESAWASRSENRSRIEAALVLARSERRIADDGEGWDADPFLLGVQNGVVDLRSGKLREATREDKVTRRAPVAFDASATCPVFDAFLRRIQPDPEIRAYLQRRAGYALTGSVAEQDLLFLYGSGSNGKTTFANALMDVLGRDYSLQAAPGLLLRKAAESHPTELADLDGARLVVSSEVDDGRAIAEGLIKQLTGGDRIRARHMRQDFYEFEANFKIFLLANHKPVVRGTDWAIWRRIKLVPFEQTIPQEEKDPNLRDKLRQEAAGILNWMIRGCLAWQRSGMCEPDSVLAATQEYRKESDPLAAFLTEACVVAPHCEAPSSQLYKAYQEWCTGQGVRERDRLSLTAFGRLMKERFTREERRTGNFYLGVGIRDRAADVRPVEGYGCLPESGVEGSDPFLVQSQSLKDHEEEQDNYPQPSTPSTEPADVEEALATEEMLWEEAVI